LKSLDQQLEATTDAGRRNEIKGSIQATNSERNNYWQAMNAYQAAIERFVLRAPHGGVVMSPPKIDQIGRLWERDQSVPFCSIGDPKELQLLMPVSPTDYRLLKTDLAENPDLSVTVRVQGRAEVTWKGRVHQVFDSEAKEVPPQLTSKFGGPLAVKPSQQQNTYQPQAQQFLVVVYFLKSDDYIEPGTLAQVKIHCRWRSCAWWVWRSISSLFDLGLM
jgi:hypothetical protein